MLTHSPKPGLSLLEALPPSQPQVSMVQLRFDLPLWHRDIPDFRGAINGLVNPENDLFHNHDNDAGRSQGFKHRYPLIHYRVQEGYAALVGFNAGAVALEQLRNSGKLDGFNMRGQHLPLKLLSRESDHHVPLEVLPDGQSQRYRLYHYIPFGGEKYQAYKSQHSLMDKVPILQSMVRNHLVSFAYGVGWQLPAAPLLQVAIEDIDRVKTVLAFGVRMMAFDLTIRVNAMVPSGIAVGRKTSIGFGEVRHFERLTTLI